MRSLLKIGLEAVVVGISIVILALFIFVIMERKLPEKSAKSMIIGSFLVGFLGHIIFEFSGLNRSFCLTAAYD